MGYAPTRGNERTRYCLKAVLLWMNGGVNSNPYPPLALKLTQSPESSVETELARRLTDKPTSNEDIENNVAAVAGPSQPYVHQQADALGKMARKAFKCTACIDSFRMADVLQLQCDHEYCRHAALTVVTC